MRMITFLHWISNTPYTTIILGKHSLAIFTENSNTVESDESCLIDNAHEWKSSTIDSRIVKSRMIQEMLAKLLDDKNYDTASNVCDIENWGWFIRRSGSEIVNLRQF